MDKLKTLQVIVNQYFSELIKLSELSQELELPYSAEELLNFSGLSIGSYKVRRKGRTYHYIKLMGIRTGELSEREELLLVRKPLESSERERRVRREAVHIKNLSLTPKNKELVGELHYYWQRAKALRKWLWLSGYRGF